MIDPNSITAFNPKTPNYKVLNALRNEATPDYQSRVPKATQADVQSSIRALTNYTPVYNEFVSAIVNKIGLTIAKYNNWSNPLAVFKRGQLEYGDTIEEIQTGLVEAYVYSPDRDYGEKALFAKEYPEVQTSYHTVNRQNYYKVTVNRELLLRAFTSENGLAEFINSLMQAPTTSDNLDEYLLMRRLFAEYEENGGFFKVRIPEIDDVDPQPAARRVLRTLRATGDKLTFISRRYNAARMPSFAAKSDLILFCTPDFKSAIDVEGLAALFGVEYGEVEYRTIVIDEFNIPGVQAILTTKDFFVVADTHYSTTTQANPVGLHDNFFLHHWQIVSASRFVPAIAFSVTEGTSTTLVDPPVTGVSDIVVYGPSDSPVTELSRGGSFTAVATALIAGNAVSANAVRFEMTGNRSTRSYINQDGSLHVSLEDTTESVSITVRTTNIDGATFSKTRALAVNGTRGNLWPNPAAVVDTQPGVNPA